MRRTSLAGHAPRHPLLSRSSRLFPRGLPAARHARGAWNEVRHAAMATPRKTATSGADHAVPFTLALLSAALLDRRAGKAACRRRAGDARARRPEVGR